MLHKVYFNPNQLHLKIWNQGIIVYLSQPSTSYVQQKEIYFKECIYNYISPHNVCRKLESRPLSSKQLVLFFFNSPLWAKIKPKFKFFYQDIIYLTPFLFC